MIGRFSIHRSAKVRYRFHKEKKVFYYHLPISADPPQVPCCDCLANLIMASVYSLEAEAAPVNKNKKTK